MFCLDTGTFEQKEQLLEAVLEQWGPRQGSGCHVATSQRHDVESTLQKSTSGNVVTSQRCDVSTLRRLNVATSQRRDVDICSSSFKVRMAQKLGYREAYERRHGIPEQSDTDFYEVPGICTVSYFLDIIMMFLTLNILIFSFSMF